MSEEREVQSMTTTLLQQALAPLKLMMEHSAWEGTLQLSDALANIDDFAKAAQPAPVPVPLTQCNDNDSPWLICKTCAAVGRCAQACGSKPLSLDFIDRHIGPDEGDREAVVAIVREVERAHGITASPKQKL